MIQISVIVPTHNPHAGRLRRTLEALRAQTLPAGQWEALLVDNASAPAITPKALSAAAPVNLQIVGEPTLGLTAARRRGIAAARGELIVLVDDDNVLAPDYLEQVVALFAAHQRLGAAGGRNNGEFETPRPPWWRPEFDGMLACRDLGDAPEICPSLFNASSGRSEYPACAPVGAGMALRRRALDSWLAHDSGERLSDRRGGDLSSSGDNDIVLTVLRVGWAVGYFPSLVLTHLIPNSRMQADYLARLRRGIARSWMHVLARHDINPWRPIPGWTVPLRQAKAWFAHRAWSGPAERILWQGACGQFDGLAELRK